MSGFRPEPGLCVIFSFQTVRMQGLSFSGRGDFSWRNFKDDVCIDDNYIGLFVRKKYVVVFLARIITYFNCISVCLIIL